jgi:intracellular sulfur oxidation DsrE/DsrF family protein
MKQLPLFCFAIFFCVSVGIAQQTGRPVKDGVLVHLSSNDPHRVVMALTMAVRMSEDKNVLVYCDINGIDVVLKGARDVEYPTFSSAQTSLRKLIEKGITVFACPSCLKAAGKTGADLMPGVRTAEKDALFTFTKGRIVALDY